MDASYDAGATKRGHLPWTILNNDYDDDHHDDYGSDDDDYDNNGQD